MRLSAYKQFTACHNQFNKIYNETWDTFLAAYILIFFNVIVNEFFSKKKIIVKKGLKVKVKNKIYIKKIIYLIQNVFMNHYNITNVPIANYKLLLKYILYPYINQILED